MSSTAAGGTKRITLRDIAKVLDLSHATVSRALNDKEDAFISEATRERVRLVAREMGYRPNHAARSLATGRTGLVALWLWSMRLQGSYHASVAERMYDAAREHSYQLLIDLIGPGQGRERSFDRWNVDGIIAHEAAPAIEAQLQGGIRPPVPLVSTGAFHFVEGVDQVRVNLAEGAAAAMRHLLEGGRRKIMYVTDDLPDRPGEARYEAYCQGLLDAGLAPRCLDVIARRAEVRAAIKADIEAHGVPDALYCHNDDIAIGAYRALLDLGIRVPDDVAIVGFDGVEDGEFLEVPLTTVAQPMGEMCSLACDFLQSRIESPSAPIQVAELNARLVIRDSTRRK